MRLPRLTKADKALANSLNLEWLKLSNQALRAVPGSPRQKALQSKLAKVPKYKVQVRLEELRKELRAERISYGELFELQSLIPYIDPEDVELLEAAGVPELTTAQRQRLQAKVRQVFHKATP